jgi:hypothetical protein
MKVKVVNYKHPENGISIQMIPETEFECGILKGMWLHAELNTGHPCGEMGDTGYYISWKPVKKS